MWKNGKGNLICLNQSSIERGTAGTSAVTLNDVDGHRVGGELREHDAIEFECRDHDGLKKY